MKTILFLFLMSAVTITCKSVKQEATTSGPFNIIESYYYSWAGGDSGLRGTTYIVVLENNNEQVQFESLWVNHKMLKLQRREDDKRILLRADHSTRDLETPDKEEKVEKPMKSAAQGIVKYAVNGTTYYMEVNSFEKRKGQTYN
jgi:hypothetical protein